MIRTMTPDDLDAVGALWLNGNIAAHPFIAPDFFTQHLDFIKLILPSSTVFVQDIDGVKGFIGLSDTIISGLYIDPAYQRQGLGLSLLNKAKAQHNELFVYLYADNQAAHHFFASQGFEIIDSGINDETGQAEHLLHCQVQHAVNIGKCAL